MQIIIDIKDKTVGLICPNCKTYDWKFVEDPGMLICRQCRILIGTVFEEIGKWKI